MDCPFCTIPDREHLLYKDEHIYLVQTNDMKGHKVRVMAATLRHTKEPSFVELTKIYTILHKFMSQQGLDEWYLTDCTFGHFPDHFHLIVCDGLGTGEELKLLYKTPKVRFPLDDPQFYPGNIMIGIPTHNEIEHISDVVKKSLKYGDVYVYDDQSTDGTAELAISSGARVLSDPSKTGYGAGLNTLFAYAKSNYDILITIDGDGQHNPDEIPKFLNTLQQGADVVLGNRFLTGSDIPFYRKAFIKIMNVLTDHGDSQCGFRAYNRKALSTIRIVEEDFGASLEILRRISENQLSITEVPCTITYEATEHTLNPLTHGMTLIESLFWNKIWVRPYTMLGIPAFIMFLLSGVFGVGLIIFYNESGIFVLSYGILFIGSLLTSLFLVIATFFIAVQRRLLMEIQR